MGNFTEINFLDGRASTKIWMSLERRDYLAPRDSVADPAAQQVG
jgi:hypothetical protein